jgi:hypothetical protein
MAKGHKGQPPFEPTDQQRAMVEQFTAVGMTEAQICMLTINPSSGKPITPKTLRKFFRTELDTGGLKANAKVSSNMFKMATGEGKHAFNAGKYWLNCRAPEQWSERNHLDITPEGGGSIKVEFVKPKVEDD